MNLAKSFKIISFAVLINSTLPVHADFFAGVDGGYLNALFNDTIQQRVPLGPISPLNDSANQGTYGILGGYQYNTITWQLGLAGFYNWDNHLTHTRVENTTTTCKSVNNDYGFKFIPGFSLTPFLDVQGLVGLSIGDLEFKSSGSRNNVDNRYTRPGILAGAGLDFTGFTPMHFGVNYEFVRYQKENDLSGPSGFYLRNGYVVTNRILFSFTYFFS